MVPMQLLDQHRVRRSGGYSERDAEILDYRYYYGNETSNAMTLIQTRRILARRLVKWMRFVPHLQRILRGHSVETWLAGSVLKLRQNAAASCMNRIYRVAKIH